MARPVVLFVCATACACACASSISCVGRDLSKENFACGSGGVCRDGSIDTTDAIQLDSGHDSGAIDLDADDGADTGGQVTDARAIDAGAIDSGIIPPTCQGAIPLPANGVAYGDTTNAHDNYQGSCSTQMGGRDMLFSLGFPGDLTQLDISTHGSAFDTVLYIFHNDCNATSELRCNDDRVPGVDLTSRIVVKNVGHGQFFIVVDGYDMTTYGRFKLTVSGIVAAGQPCDPSLQYLKCAQGACLPDVVGYRCQDPIDCTQSACQSGPTVMCPANARADPGTTSAFTGASASSMQQISARAWDAITAPTFSLPFIAPGRNADTASVTFALAGMYVLRYSAIDSLRQENACQTMVQVASDAALRVEAYWDPPDLALSTALDLHVLNSTAATWFDPMHDCYPATCAQAPLPWSAQHEGAAIGQGPEVIRVTRPTDGIPYRIGVQYVGGDITGTATAHLRVFCNGVAHELGAAQLPIGNGNPDVDNSFWKAADVITGPSDCTITKLVDAMNNPLVVTASIAHRTR